MNASQPATAGPDPVADLVAGLERLLRDFDRCYERRPMATTIVLTDFFLPYLRDLYRTFDGDIALALVLGEIGHASTRRFTEGGRRDALDLAEADLRQLLGSLRPCNALSASLASGVPRETARRKVQELAQRGWIAEHDGGWVATAKAGETFVPAFNREQARRLLATARRLIELLGRG